MKKITLLAMAALISIGAMAQNFRYKADPIHRTQSEKQTIGIEPVKDASIIKSDIKAKPVIPAPDRDVNIVNIIDIGTSANPWSYVSNNIGNQRSMVWVDPELNIVTNFHRMGGNLDVGGYSGDLGYDISFDGGTTWTTMVECYIAEDNGGGEYFIDAARYPSHGIYNPTNNIEDAYIAFYAPNLDGSNSDTDSGWGGHARGTSKISDPSVTTKHVITSENGTFLYIPEAYDVTKEGLSISVDNNVDWTSGSGVYQGTLTLNKGVWNSDQNDFIYTTSELDFDVESPWYTQVAFAPDGMTGYIVSLGNDGTTWSVDGNPNIYPIIFKTTDGGQNWSDPTPIQMDGPNGIGGIVYHLLTDQDLENLYEPPIPAREDIPYTFTGDMDIVVTADGNLHIAGLVGVAGESDPGAISFYVTNGFGRIIDMFTKDGGATWEIETMGKIATYDYQWDGDGIHEANRTQITTNPDRDMIFVSWLDTDIEDAEDNDSPNIWCRGFDPQTYLKTNNGSGLDEPTNVTIFSEGMWSAYFATAPKTCFEFQDGVFTIPYVYVDWTTTDDLQPVQYKYISDFSFSMDDFTVQGIDNPTETKNNNSVSQNFPNPFKNESYISLNLIEGTDVTLEVYTLTGQKVSEKTYGYLTNGSHTLTIKGNDLNPGVYFYTVIAGDNKYTHKMILK